MPKAKAQSSDSLRWMLDDAAPQPALFEEADPKRIEEGRAYDEHGNVRPADARWTDDKAVVEKARETGTLPAAKDAPTEAKTEGPDPLRKALDKESVIEGGVVKEQEPVPTKVLGTNPTAEPTGTTKAPAANKQPREVRQAPEAK